MRTSTVVAVTVSALAVAAAAITVPLVWHDSSKTSGSGPVVSVTRTVPAFDRIDLQGAAAVAVDVGGPRSVSVHGDGNVVPLIETRVLDGVLVVSEKGPYRTHHELTVQVSTPTLTGSTLSGAGKLLVTGIDVPRFTAELSGTGLLDLGGSVGALDATVSGVGAAQLEHLQASTAHVAVTGAGMAHVFATRTLDAAVSGTGSILYSGDPARVSEQVTGVGVVVKS